MTEDRLEKLETLLAHQDETLRQLNDALYKQQLQIQGLRDEIDALRHRVESAEQPAPDALPGHELPPHY
ncbi:SlyX family protein [Abyssibacter profundi]|uniref:Protein slyX n=1 Tax=Abyssibacter profundi TaxID=2182787 RepID=A0A363UQ75_9GAMM|nr:SlyX family protein [Abyssibacter profundi]MBV59964.1 protein slyX [Nevskiales bacterium]PWN57665.1 protein slyX [Abyssibacter profundi]